MIAASTSHCFGIAGGATHAVPQTSRSARPSRARAGDAIDRWALSRGQPAAWDQLVRHYWPKMLCQARAIVRGGDEAQDVAQAVLVRLWRRREQLTRTQALEAYLMSAVRNQARNALRQRKSRQRLLELEAADRNPRSGREDQPGYRLDRSEQRAIVETIQGELTQAQRIVFRELRRDPDRSARQVGRQLGCSHKNVLATLRRIRQSVPDEQITLIREGLRR